MGENLLQEIYKNINAGMLLGYQKAIKIPKNLKTWRDMHLENFI